MVYTGTHMNWQACTNSVVELDGIIQFHYKTPYFSDTDAKSIPIHTTEQNIHSNPQIQFQCSGTCTPTLVARQCRH